MAPQPSLFALVLTGRRSRRAAPLLGLLVLGSFSAQAAGPAKAPKKGSKAAPAPTPPAEPPPAPAAPPAPVAPPPPAVEPLGDHPSLAALEVSVTVPNEKLDGSAFSEMLVSSVDQTGLFKVISSAEIATLLGAERQRQLMGCSDDSCLTELTEALGARLLLQGQVGKVGENYLVSVRLIDPRRAMVLGRASAQTTESGLLLTLLWKAVQDTIDASAANVPPAVGEQWRTRKRAEPPEAVVTERFQFGLALTAMGGVQPLAASGHRFSVGGEFDVTLRRARWDFGLGVVISPTPGARVQVGFALLHARNRLTLSLRGAAFPGAGLYGGGPGLTWEFLVTPHIGVHALVAAEAYGGSGSLVLAGLGGVGGQVHF